MSKELTGQNFQLVGSNDYFMALNKAYSIHRILPFSDPKDYAGALKALCIRINDIFEEIYSDLQKYEKFIRYVPQSNRMNLVKIILGLRDICIFSRYSTGKSEKCIDILKLDTYGTRTISKASDSEIDEAVKEVLDGRHTDLPKYDRVDFIKKATEYNLKDIIEKDERARAYFNLFPNYDSKDFFTDVWNNLYFLDSYNRFRGKCGKEICSKAYFDYIEKEIFYQDMPNYYLGAYGDRLYKNFIVDALQSIVNDIKYDLEQGLKNNDYILDISAQNISSVCKQLEQYGISCSSIEKTSHKLAWFCGGDPAQILLLQQKLNQLGFYGSKGKLLEDGVYGKETNFAWVDFVDSLASAADASDQMTISINKNIDILPGTSDELALFLKSFDKSTIESVSHSMHSFKEYMGIFDAILDLIRIGSAVQQDLDANNTILGVNTVSTVSGIAGGAVGGYIGFESGMAIGAMVGSIVPGVGTLGGIIIGAMLGYLLGSRFSSKAEEVVSQAVVEAYDYFSTE